MEERINLSKVQVLELAKGFPIEPMFNKVVITLNKEEEVGFSTSDATLDEVQYVIAGTIKYGDVVITPGDKVILDLKALQRPVRSEGSNAYEPVMQIEIDPLYIEGNVFGMINDRCIKAKDNR